MPRPQFRITSSDLHATRAYLTRKLVLDDYLDQAGAADSFVYAKDDPTLLNQWCDANLNAKQWRQLHNAIRAARLRQQGDNSKHVALTHDAWCILSQLAEREHVTLSAVIENHLSPLLRVSANDDQINTSTKSSTKSKRASKGTTLIDLTRPHRLLSDSERKKIDRWRMLAEQRIADGDDVDRVITFLNSRTRGVTWTPHTLFLHVSKSHWRNLCISEIRKLRGDGLGWKAIAENLNYRQIGTLETEHGKQIWTWPRVKQLVESSNE